MTARTALIILAVGLVIRFLWSASGIHLWADSHAYFASAQALLSGNWAAYHIERPPGYPLFLALVLRLTTGQSNTVTDPQYIATSVVWVQTLLGLGTALLSALVAKALFRSERLAMAAGIATALLPDLIVQERTLLTETLYTFFLMLSLWLLVNRSAQYPAPKPEQTGWALLLATGLALACLSALRGLGLALVFAVGLGRLFNHTRAQRLWLIGPSLLLVMGWSTFQAQVHQFWGFTAGGGLNQLYKVVDFIDLQSPHHPVFKTTLAERRTFYPPYRTYEAVNDTHILLTKAEGNQRPYWQTYLAHDRIAATIAREAMLRDPLAYLQVTWREFLHLLTLGSESDPEAALWGLLLLGGLLGLYLSESTRITHRWAALFLSLHLAVYPWLTVCEARYRFPLEPLLVIYTLYTVRSAWRWWRESPAPTRPLA